MGFQKSVQAVDQQNDQRSSTVNHDHWPVITAVSLRLWNLTFQQMPGWVLLMARTAATTNVEQPALRQEATVRRRTNAAPGPDCSCRCSCTGPGPLGPLRAQWYR